MALLEAQINGVWTPLPTPSPKNYFPGYTHLENSFIDARGYLHRDIVRRNRAKVTCGWNALDQNELAFLQSLYNLDYFNLKYTDSYGNRVIKKVYAGPLDGKVVKMDPSVYLLLATTDVTMNFIEY